MGRPPIVAFLWHMHQPSYLDRKVNCVRLPWVRLHGTKAYYDMAVLAERFAEVHQTFNLVPSLIAQIEDLVEHRVQDRFLDVTNRPAADLDPDDRVFVLQHFFMAHWESMIRPAPRYWSLLLKRGITVGLAEWPSVARRFSSQELLDLQVWFNLAWFGYAARQRYPAIEQLRAKGERFSEEDKRAVVDAQAAVLRELVPRYRALAEAGVAELTTSPFYHPIMPLLIDTESARRATPEAKLPERFAAPEDVDAQLARAMDHHVRVFGRRPEGLWPPEGAVSPEVVPIAARHGVRWMASDEGVLARSIAGRGATAAPYAPYRITVDGASLHVVFRDRTLSDLIGFTYAHNPPHAAAEDFCARIRAVAERDASSQPVVAVMLDGENPWEAYPDGGEGFLSAVYRRLADAREVRAATVGEAIREAPAVTELSRLHSGSWINQNFRIWIGHPEDNQAWTLLRRARQFLAARGGDAESGALQDAWDALYAAEGSDWFWWYGDEFSSMLSPEFDRIFRLHLARVYEVLDQPVPPALRQAIKIERGQERMCEPVRLIHPTIDGRATSFYEWWSASRYAVRSDAGQMYCPVAYASAFFFGFDLANLYLRLDVSPGVLGSSPGTFTGRCHVVAPRPLSLAFPLCRLDGTCTLTRGDGADTITVPTASRAAIDRVVEVAVPFADLEIKEGERVEFFVEVWEGGVELGRYPPDRPCSFTVPGGDFESRMWSV
ncbi:MAG: glycoside hydrolase family 57 protein [Nitrospirota bacterium]